MGGKPPTPTAPPPPIPPVRENAADIGQAAREAKLASARRKGLGATLLAGESTSGGGQGQSPFGGKTLLGS
jgi:hypothetical protein